MKREFAVKCSLSFSISKHFIGLYMPICMSVSYAFLLAYTGAAPSKLGNCQGFLTG